MKNILKRLSTFAMLIAIVSNVFVVSPIATEHEHKVSFWVESSFYQGQDENYHRYYTVWESRCNCGANLGIVEETFIVESHSWNGDTCSKCTYKKTHTHEGVSKGNKVTTLKSYDENTHTYSIAYENLCSCGESVGLIDETTSISNHNFKNDKCVECGYTKSHTHTGTTKGKKVTTLKSYDENTHTYSIAYENLCSCGESVGLIDETTSISNHNFKNDKCVECGYQKNHTHEASTLGKHLEWYENANENGHTLVTANESLCSCGEIVGLVDRVEKHENHSFADDKCTKCGYITKSSVKDEQGILGDFFKDTDVVGFEGQKVIGEIPSMGLVIEVSNLLASKNIASDDSFDLVPLIGSLKYSDEVYTVVKNADDLKNITDNKDGFYEAARPVTESNDEKTADAANISGNFTVVHSEIALHTKASAANNSIRLGYTLAKVKQSNF